ncbi:hypothetical protein DNI29_22065 [Hymenobacter sediminis]|uniref:hypothetical protein n=1 Tax=Hymenobacter sediminis TaxID=2218621 RepID=UPI000DA690A4|nr:hypothetical protein [Hymenobacter sediminis]RPD44087.1 hypothetical protein DNI29_22065 [Hymenobacter sediminis]
MCYDDQLPPTPSPIFPPFPVCRGTLVPVPHPQEARLAWLVAQHEAGALTWPEFCALRDAPRYLP